jgi:hypothetical protein
MNSTPASNAVRERLRQAQQAEANALKAVATATKAVERGQARLEAADTGLAHAQAEVVAASGLERAAFLLGVEPTTLRRRIRALERDGQVDVDGQRTVSMTDRSTARQA